MLSHFEVWTKEPASCIPYIPLTSLNNSSNIRREGYNLARESPGQFGLQPHLRGLHVI